MERVEVEDFISVLLISTSPHLYMVLPLPARVVHAEQGDSKTGRKRESHGSRKGNALRKSKMMAVDDSGLTSQTDSARK